MSALEPDDREDAAADARLRGIIASAACSLQSDETANVVGSRIGSYAVGREVGRGGMGTVYLAFRDDDQFRQRVAIKVIGRGMSSAFALNRFRRERQLLADLQHPNIARLLDGGATQEGLPFFAMEYIEGVPVTEYCRNKSLNERSTLDLFLQICAAVQYAHRNLIIHGDLKPGNILVADDGVPKLLDFGIASLIGAQGTAGEVAGPLSSHYASPEQKAGRALTAVTDIYSLGVVLGEMIAGERPTDLDCIIHKATCSDPDGRYGSVEELAQDTRRYLNSWPVQARPASPVYRFAKFARRRWIPLLAAAAVLVSLLGGMLAALVKAREAEAARQVSQERLTQMVSLSNRSLTDVSVLMERIPGAMSARRELVGTTIDFLRKLSQSAGADMPLRMALARAYLRLGMLQGGPDSANMGDIPAAVTSYRAGAALLDGVRLDPPPRETERLLLWLELEQKASMLLGLQTKTAEAIAILQRAFTVLDGLPPSQLAAKDVARRKAGLFLARSRADHADPGAPAYAARYLDSLDALVKRYPGDADLLYELSVAHTELGYLLWRAPGDNPEAASSHYEMSMRIREQLVRDHPADTVYRRVLMLAYEHFGSLQGGPLYVSLGNRRLAAAYYKKGLALGESAAADPQDVLWVADFAGLLIRYAALEPPDLSTEESLAALRRAIGLFESNTIAKDSVRGYDGFLATAHNYAGRRLALLGRYAEASMEYERAQSSARAALALNSANADGLQQSMAAERGMVQVLVSKRDKAGAIDRATTLVRKTEKDNNPKSSAELHRKLLAQAYVSLASANRAFGQPEPACDAARSAVANVQPLLTGRPWDSNASLAREAHALTAGCSQSRAGR